MADGTNSNSNNYYYYNTKQNSTHHANNPSKYFTHFLYKAAIVAIFLVLLPLFPSQAPEFINQTLNTRGWEILHLVFVGIAVSYGLFSKKNDDITSEKENNSNNPSKFDSAQSYVSRFLQVSSVFDDDNDISVRPDDIKVQTWSSQYYRNEPVVVVEEEHSVLDKEQRGVSSVISEKPLLLPVRSLKSRVVDDDVVVNGTGKESYVVSGGSISRSNANWGSKRFSKNLSGGLDYKDENLEENLKESVVLPSPIPWRSRSGRMEMREEADISPPPYTLPPSMEESEPNRSFRGQLSRPSRPNSANSSPKVLSPSPSMSSPKKYSPSPSFSSEAQGKSAEDFVRKKSIYRAPPPPPPPPPPPLSVIRKSSSMKPRSSDIDHEAFVGKDYERSFSSGSSQMPMSVRTVRSNDSLADTSRDKGFDDGINKKAEKRFNELESNGRKTAGFDQSSFKTERLKTEHVKFMSQPTFVESLNEEDNEEFEENLVLESDLESETEEDDEIGKKYFAPDGASAANSSAEEAASGSASDGGPDVDKKADEFIKKFREQIRLQRIESIKRSSAAQIRRNTATAR